MKATDKSPAIEACLSKMTGNDRVKMVAEGRCTTCSATGLDDNSFKDELSRREYTISGMCQECQTVFFTETFEEPHQQEE